MGTQWRLIAVLSAACDLTVFERTLQRAFDLVIRQMSQWDPNSELSRFNASDAGSHHRLSPQFALVLDCALTISEASHGAFDPALGRHSSLWGFGAEPFRGTAPEKQELERAQSPKLALRELLDNGILTQPGGLSLDLSGIAKGFAVDLAIAMLQREGVDHALLEVGGEIKGIGLRTDGLPWWVELENAPGSSLGRTRIGLTGWAAATSGNYHRRRSSGGQSWSHSLDPATGRPLDDRTQSVSVLHLGCMQADALATAILVLGPDDGMKFADRMNIPARIVTQDGSFSSQMWRRWQQ